MKSNTVKNLNVKLAAAVLFALLLASFVIFSLKGMVKIYRLRSERQGLTADISTIKKSNKKIERQIYELTYDKQYVANIAREKLNMIKKGEIVFKFVGKDKKNKNNTGGQNRQVHTAVK